MVHEVVLADIQKHAGQALTDRKATVTEIAEQISGYAGITELNFKIINQLLEKLEIRTERGVKFVVQNLKAAYKM